MGSFDPNLNHFILFMDIDLYALGGQLLHDPVQVKALLAQCPFLFAAQGFQRQVGQGQRNVQGKFFFPVALVKNADLQHPVRQIPALTVHGLEPGRIDAQDRYFCPVAQLFVPFVVQDGLQHRQRPGAVS